MRVAPILNGGLRIDAENSHDWETLRWILLDAHPDDLARRLGGLTGSEAADWEEFVVPDLIDTFEAQVATVRAAIAEAAATAEEGPGSLFIEKARAGDWYGALNQARLALHARHDFPEESPDPDDMPFKKRAAFFRYQFYMIIQDLLLERVMKA